ncbi:MAG TPA: CoA transferase [Myxococcales bacterium]|nr:CoA transferase [Myxococcales bacterium]
MSECDLREIRVLELGESVSSAFAARQLADHGANVVKVETSEEGWMRQRGPFPAGSSDPERSGLFLALNTSKRSVRLDLSSDAGRADLLSLIDWADILIHDSRPNEAEALGIDAPTLEDRRPDLVTLAISPFGSTGPYANFHATELTVSSGGGWASLCPAATGRVDLPPLKVYGQQCGFMSGVAGAAVAMAIYSTARRTGVGEYIDFSEQAYTASVLEQAIPLYSYTQQVATRYGTRLLIPWSIFDCLDGQLFVVCVEQDQWERLVALMGSPEWSSLEVFSTAPGRSENHDLVHGFVQEWLAEKPVLEIYHQMQEHRICAAPVMGPAEMAESEHLLAREFFVDVEHRGAGRLLHLAPAARSETGRQGFSRGAPSLGEHNAEILGGQLPGRTSNPETQGAAPNASLPLEGIRVADLSWAWAGPFCAMNLAHLGAEVIRFESEGRPDLYRRIPLHPDDVEKTLNTSGMFAQWNQGKKSVALNLAEPQAIELLKDFIDTCDVVVENFATGVMDRLGLGYDTLSKRNPGLIMASISGYGETGPYANYMGYGPAIPPLTGLTMGTGFVGGRPAEMGVSMPDPTAGITMAFEVCAALEKRRESGRGDHLDVSLWEATAVFSAEAWMDYVMNGAEPTPQGSRDPAMSPHGFFPTHGEDLWISIACDSEEQWQALADELAPALRDDPRFRNLSNRKLNESELEEELASRTLERERWELCRALQARGVAAFPAMTSEDLLSDPHLEARGFLETKPHPEVGVRKHTGIPYSLRRRPNGVRKAAPVLGADTSEVLSEALGYSEEDIHALIHSKVLY